MSSFEHVNTEDMLQKIVQIMTKCYDVHNAFVFLVDAEKGLGKIKINTGVFAEFKIERNVEEFIMEEVSKKQKTIIVNIMETQQFFFKDKFWNKISTLILIPLKYAGELFGIVGIACGKKEKLVAGERLCLLESFVDMTAVVLSKISKGYCNNEKEIKELRQVVEKYFQVFYMSPNAIALLSSDEIFIEVNPSFTFILGFTKEDAIGKSMKDLGIWVNFDDREKVRQMLAESTRNQNIELPLHKKNGQVIYVDLILRRSTLQGKMCYLAIAHDISMQVAAKAKQDKQEKELVLSRNKLATAATLASIGPWEYDTEKERFEFSDEFYALYGTNSVREGKFMGFADYIREFIHPEDVWMFSGEKEILSLALPDNSTVPDIIHRIIRRDGAVRTVLVRRRFIRDSDGNMIKAYGTNQDITERIRIEEEQLKQADMIKHMAYYDSLTGIPNRNNLNEWLSEHIDKTKHSGASGTVFLFDLDQLKMVNDAYGHSFGDRVITTVSARLVGIFGEHAFIARIGGDEFIVILQGQYSKEQIEIKAQKAIESISKKQEYLDMSMHVTVSVGIAHYPKDGETVEEIIKNVENAMYEAKKNGRNCWRFYNKEMQIAAYKKIRLIEGLRYAITRGELYIVYQPQIILPQGLVGGVEALLRWNSKEYGNVSPEVFIPLAEQAGFINSIGNWVLMETCSFAHRLKENGWPNLSVAINISTMQVASADFVHTVDNAIRTAEIKPKQIEIEITESLLMASLDEALFKLNQIKAMGVNIALDDFGTGYSSLTYLRKLPVKKLKIDKSFIDMIETDDFGARMIGAIINMAKAINMNVVAEGVETKKQLDYLVEKGCACVQGYFFSKPLTETEIYKFLRDFHKDK